MCPSKLEGSRGLRALESAPAQLPGWRLSFTHRWARRLVASACLLPALITGPRARAGQAAVPWDAQRGCLPLPISNSVLPSLAQPHPTHPRTRLLRGAMGNLERLRPGDDAPHVHGVLHLLSPADFGKLANCEHEYRWAGWGCCVVSVCVGGRVGGGPGPGELPVEVELCRLAGLPCAISDLGGCISDCCSSAEPNCTAAPPPP